MFHWSLGEIADLEAELKFAEIATAPVANGCGAIAVLGQAARQGRDREACILVTNEVVTNAVVVGPCSRQQRQQTGSGTGAGHIAGGEQRATSRQANL